MLHLVEIGHFTPPVESLIKGTTTNRPGPDLDYTLRAIPNHHRALAAVLRLWERTKEPTPGGLPKVVECYFERAVRFAPNDHIARMIYASYLIKDRRTPEAVGHLSQVRSEAGRSALTHYNLGMIYFDANMYEDALVEAHIARRLGIGKRDLEVRLKAAGRWQDPPMADEQSQDPGGQQANPSTNGAQSN